MRSGRFKSLQYMNGCVLWMKSNALASLYSGSYSFRYRVSRYPRATRNIFAMVYGRAQYSLGEEVERELAAVPVGG
jgi:phosphatidylserine/phosphatidylglycerophosphate/cardiolipin synthase-like enzyme